jgi:von Willebrand factor type A domain
MRPWTVLLCSSLWGLGCQSPAPSEATPEACTNAKDDDGDGAVDCVDLGCRVFAVCVPSDAGALDAAPSPLDATSTCAALDLVLVVDESSSMTAALAKLRSEVGGLVSSLEALDPNAQVALVTFVDDARAARDGQALDVPALEAELADAAARAPMNHSPVSGVVNQDCAENALDALALAATLPALRPGSERLVLVLTDDTFAENPSVLSGPYGGGVVVQSTYASLSQTLVARGLHVSALTRTGAGRACGAPVASAQVGPGFDSPWNGQPSLPDATGGGWSDLDVWLAGNLDLNAWMSSRAAGLCP